MRTKIEPSVASEMVKLKDVDSAAHFGHWDTLIQKSRNGERDEFIEELDAMFGIASCGAKGATESGDHYSALLFTMVCELLAIMYVRETQERESGCSED